MALQPVPSTEGDDCPEDVNEQMVRDLCMNNGFDYTRTDLKTIESLELFLSVLPKIPLLQGFVYLSELRIIGSCIEELSNLEGLANLCELWICEAKVKRIQGLSGCLSLTKLYLYGNQLPKIENLDTLIDLQVLWLNENKINAIEGISELKRLRDLNLSNNNISKIGNAFDNHQELVDLNLSGNNISSLKDLTNLSRLSNLKSLGFKDPMYLPNPVASLCNYSTYVLYHIPTLMRLDSVDVSQKVLKEFAEATVMKKKIYYRMRMNMLERSYTELKIALRDEMGNILEGPATILKKLYCVTKEIERCISGLELMIEAKVNNSNTNKEPFEGSENECDLNKDEEDENECSDPELLLENHSKKLKAVKNLINYWESRYESVEKNFIQICAQAQTWLNVDIHHLQMEFATGGNVRFENGTSADVWYNSCQDLIQSRFSVGDFKDYHITGLKVHKITRIQNRILKHKFDEKFERLTDGEENGPLYKDSSGRRIMDYLFYVMDPKWPFEARDVEKLLDEGFPPANQYQSFSSHCGIPVSNSVYMSNKHVIKSIQNQKKDPSDTCPFRFGQLIICKVYLGKSVPLANDKKILEQKQLNNDSVYRTRRHSMSTCPNKKRQGTGSITDSCQCTARRCTWFLFDHEMVLPEYVVDFEYLTVLTPPMTKIFSNMMTSLREGLSCKKMEQYLLDEKEQDKFESVMAMDPIVPSRPRLTFLSEEMLLKQTGHAHISKITSLNLHGSGLSKIKMLSTLVSLKTLILSFNELMSMSELGGMTNLEHLDVSFNQITSLEGLKLCPSLNYLDISWNKFKNSREEVGSMRKYLPALRTLKTLHNPWLKKEDLRLRCLGRLRFLAIMDDKPITDEETAIAIRMAASSRIAFITVMAHSRTDEVAPRTLRLGPTTQVLIEESRNKPVKLNGDDKEWLQRVTTLHLDNQHLSKISNLDLLDNLMWASFKNNNITKLEGFEKCHKLRELSLSGNCISKLEGLNHLTDLEYLDVSNNSLTSLDGIKFESFDNLLHLAINNNYIDSFSGLQKSTSLHELYAGNNRIQHMREIFQIKNIPNLVILDLLGNPLVNDSTNYRLFLIYHLPSLKALDGLPVDCTEGGVAKDTFGGKLSTDFVAEKLGHSNFTEICELDLPNANLRKVELSVGDMFVNLRSLNLEQNNLSCFGGIINLVNLKVLCLNNNHIECIVPSSKPESPMFGSKPSDHSTENMTPVLEKLEVLHLGYNGINNLANLQLGRLPSLKALFLQGNEIVKIEGLDGLYDLRELVLDRNKIKHFGERSFKSQWKLHELHVEENRIRELSNMESLTSLQRLYLGLNRIQDMVELDKLECLARLLEVSVIGNPVARRLMHRPLLIFKQPHLISIDGVPVTTDERAKAELYFIEQQGGFQALQAIASSFDQSFPGLISKAKGPLKVSNLNITNNPGESYWHAASSSSISTTDDSKGSSKNKGLGASRSHTYIPNKTKQPWQS